MHMKKLIKHLNVVIRHKFWVFYNCFKVGLFFRGLVHDLSKFEPLEFNRSVKYVCGNKSQTVKEREYNEGYSLITVTHTHKNKHHWQYWVDYDKDFIIIKKMPFKYALEFVLDMMAASKTYNKKNYSIERVIDFFETRKSHYLLHPMTKKFVSSILLKYKEEGFKGIRKKMSKKIYDELDNKYSNIIFLDYNPAWKNQLEDL